MDKKTTTTKPLPCPFCGSKATINEGWGAPAGVGQAWCVSITCSTGKCGITPQLSVSEKLDSKRTLLRAAAIRIWNTRK